MDIRGPIPYPVILWNRGDFIESQDHGNQQETGEKREVKTEEPKDPLFPEHPSPRPFRLETNNEEFVKSPFGPFFVIPAKAGIQGFL